ncbi:MAG: hypothetical protein EBT92_09005 [Planctomycetes bacterium]|nr:hypothetical protein [Planctomycetota bacterium]
MYKLQQTSSCILLLMLELGFRIFSLNNFCILTKQKNHCKHTNIYIFATNKNCILKLKYACNHQAPLKT